MRAWLRHPAFIDGTYHEAGVTLTLPDDFPLSDNIVVIPEVSLRPL